VQWDIAAAGIVVGFVIGLTGMGGGALMTPMLVILFHITPSAAISSDVVASFVLKPIGGGVHIRRRTVNWTLVRWLSVGSVPGRVHRFLRHRTSRGKRLRNAREANPRWGVAPRGRGDAREGRGPGSPR
jgi:hypothetical protein